MLVSGQSPLSSVRFKGNNKQELQQKSNLFVTENKTDIFIKSAKTKQQPFFTGWLTDYLTMPSIIRSDEETKQLAKDLIEGDNKSLQAIGKLNSLKNAGFKTLHTAIVDYACDKLVTLYNNEKLTLMII